MLCSELNGKTINKKNIQLQETNLLLKESIDKQELLLKEIHHRVKNNLQIVMSLLDIQAKNTTKENLTTFIENSRSRIAAMALIHQNLYLFNSSSCISFQEYLEDLTQSIKNCFGKRSVSIVINTKDITLDLNIAIPLGLIINELVCNALKHGFQNSKGNSIITITLSMPDTNQYVLMVSDNGIGMNTFQTKKSKSIGLELVELLVLQIKGTIDISQSLKKGTKYQIKFQT